MHGSVRFEYVMKSRKPRIRVREMMENSCADNLVEIHPQLLYFLDCKLADLKIRQIVFTLKLVCTSHACCAEVDAGDLSFGPTQRMLAA
jgi:hypothetical protein